MSQLDRKSKKILKSRDQLASLQFFAPAQQQPAAGRRHDEPPDGDIPAARMPRTPGTAPSGTFGGGPEKRCAGRAQPRAARSALRRILK